MYKFGCDCTAYLNFSTLIIRCQRVYKMQKSTSNTDERANLQYIDSFLILDKYEAL